MLANIYGRSIGLDVHQSMIVGTFLADDPSEAKQVRSFGTFHDELQSMAQVLKDFMPDVVVMESTGIYWFPVYEALEALEIPTLVVNARHIKQVPGRKTDTQDSEWLAELGRCGLLRGSFIPPKDFRELRLWTRYRSKLVRMRTSEKNRLHKILEGAGIKLSSVVSDVDGASARSMIASLIEGEESPTSLANLARGKLRHKIDQLLLAFGSGVSDRHRQLLRSIQLHLLWMEGTVERLDGLIVAAMSPYQRSYELLQTLPGINQVSAAALLVELTEDLSAFPSSAHLCSWAGVCPGNNESAGKRKSGRTRKANIYVKSLLVECANAAIKSHCQFKGYYQQLRCRRGHKKAVMAVAHKLLKCIYAVLKNKTPYHDPEVDYEKERVRKNAPRWIKQLKKFGYLN